jgi:hypothetical protein
LLEVDEVLRKRALGPKVALDGCTFAGHPYGRIHGAIGRVNAAERGQRQEFPKSLERGGEAVARPSYTAAHAVAVGDDEHHVDVGASDRLIR